MSETPFDDEDSHITPQFEQSGDYSGEFESKASMSEYQYTEDDAHQAAGIAQGAEWAVVDTTMIIGRLPDSEYGTPTWAVHVEGSADSGHDYPYPVETDVTVTWKQDGTAVIDEATDEQVSQAAESEE